MPYRITYDRGGRLLLALLPGLLAWGVVVYKAFRLPITIDEVSTALHYYHFSYWEIMRFPDPWPNNHILNTVLAKLSMSILGREVWTVRLPSVLSFWIYWAAAYKLGSHLFPVRRQWPLLLAAAALPFANLYLLDFFSLSRGYALACALQLAAGVALLLAYRQERNNLPWVALMCSTLGAYANFTTLLVWLAVLALGGLYWLLRRRYLMLLPWLGVAAAFLAWIAKPLRAMQSTNQFQYWTSQGFFRDTVVSVVDSVRYGAGLFHIENSWLAGILLAAFVVLGGWLAWHYRRQSPATWSRSPLLLAFLLILLTTLANIAQILLLGTPNLTYRTALLFYPLAYLVVVTALARLAAHRPGAARVLALALTAATLVHLATRTRLYNVREWWFDANTYQVVAILEQHYRERGQPLSLRPDWRMHNSFSFHRQVDSLDWLVLPASVPPAIDTAERPDYYYVFGSDWPQLADHYEIVAEYDGASRLLLKRKE